ncbi:MAG: aminotransferase class III-fold pyridoxal phosphate-dependent enzyme [Betaproteobacteria bacterium]|nr:aminotransferase class III-fold pyridoxal phosphate-dependent enzyme [Betaproteobacteria bacterium]
MAQRVARLLPGYRFDEQSFFRADACDAEVEQMRRSAFYEMAGRFAKRYAHSIEATERAKQSLSDLQFISSYRVPFQFSDLVKRHLKVGSVVSASHEVFLEDLDGNLFYDLSGSYGVNLLGYDFYKRNIAIAAEAAQGLGPVLGMYHPAVIEVAERLRVISMQDEVSFHMSGTEAVMQAVRLARYNTGKSHLVRFCGAYHGWWEDVQPGPGNPMPPREVYTLEDMSERSLKALRARKDVACVLINPLQALHPNRPAPGDSSLVDSSRRAGFDKAAYTAWLHKLRALCTERGIVLIFDEVKTGLTAGAHGASARLGVKPDLITLAKSIGGGVPLAAFGGKKKYMDFVTNGKMAHFGTFNGNPLAMAGVRAIDRICSDQALADAEKMNLQALTRMGEIIDEYQLPAHTVGFGIKGCVTWSTSPVRNYRDYKATDFGVAEAHWLFALNRGIITPPGLDEQWLISLAHGQKEIDMLVEDFRDFAKAIRS